MMTDDQILEVVQAHKEGKRIQGKHTSLSNVWVDLTSTDGIINWDFMYKLYRVAPELNNQTRCEICGRKLADIVAAGGTAEHYPTEPPKPREWTVAEKIDTGEIWSPHSGTTGTQYRAIRVREVIK